MLSTPEEPGRNRPPRIDTSLSLREPEKNLQLSLDVPSPGPALASPSSLPSFFLSSPTTEKPPSSPLWNHSSFKSSSRRNESRKLLAHVLDQLKSRVMPPSVYDASMFPGDGRDTKRFGFLAKVPTRQGSKFVSPTSIDDDDEEVNGEFSTDATFELMMQLKDVLSISVVQGWQIFENGLATEDSRPRNKSSIPFRRSRNSLNPRGRSSRSPSPSSGQARAPELLTQCISVLSSVVYEDCRYQIAAPGPMRPPNALQAITLEVSRFLLYVHRNNAKTIAQIAFALIPAFTSFPSEMHPRLLQFFEESIIRGDLEDLRYIQGANQPEKLIDDDPSAMGGQSAGVSIRVDEVQDEITQGFPGPTSSPSYNHGLVVMSTNAPHQPLQLYYLASFIPALLSSIFDSIDLSFEAQSRTDVLYRLHRLMDLIVTLKHDAYLDFLQVMAYHTAKARFTAASFVAIFWPKSIGHVTVSKPFPMSAYVEFRQGGRSHPPLLEDHPYCHQFVPWRFSRFKEGGFHTCRSCTQVIGGFGLLCPFCSCTVHFDCYDYPEGNDLINYPMVSDENVKRIALFRFSTILPTNRTKDHHIVYRHRHAFKLVNLFTLSLCFVCRKPLWGCIEQAMKCSSCLQFIHPSCVDSVGPANCVSTPTTNSEHLTIQWSELRRSCLEFYPDILSLAHVSLSSYSYEEISVMFGVLWIQAQLITNGVALGSVIVMQRDKSAAHAKEYRVDTFELHQALLCLGQYLTADSIPRTSIALDDYLRENKVHPSKHHMMFDWSTLLYIISSLKTPTSTRPEPSSPGTTTEFLGVHHDASVALDAGPNESTHPFEVVHLSHLQDVLAHDFNIRSHIVSRMLLSHLHHLGLLQRVDMRPTLFPHPSQDIKPDTLCMFSLPLGLDLSIDVETLFTSVETCLWDLDLSINEMGLLLLTRRLWPNGMASEYAMRRLTRSVMFWILAEDDSLAVILRDYLAKQRTLPGVRTNRDIVSWPSAHSNRLPSANSINNGGDYVASRKMLMARYVLPWLQAMHEQDSAVYATLLYELSLESAGLDVTLDIDSGIRFAPSNVIENAAYYDRVLKTIIRLSHNSVAFSIFDDLFVRWLDSVSSSQNFMDPMPSLYRLFPREIDAGQRYSVIDQPLTSDSNSAIDPWRVITRVASKTPSGFPRSLRWLCMFARAGVDVSVPVYMQFSTLVTRHRASLKDCLLLVNAMMSTTYLRSMGRHNLQIVFVDLHTHLAEQISVSLRSGEDLNNVYTFIRQSLGTCLLLYGCDRSRVLDLDLLHKNEVKDLPSRRKIARGSMVSDPVVIDPRMLSTLERYMGENVDDVSCMIAKFLATFLTENPLLETHEIDNFILRNSRILCLCAWQFYGIQRHEISGLRATFLLRTLVVDTQAFRELLLEWFKPGGAWEARLFAVTRAFRIILDINSPAFHVEDRQWRSSLIDVFFHYFSAMWEDDKEEIRLAVDTFNATLLPPHLDTISLCWNEFLVKAPRGDRLKLVSFLIQLRPHFPTWRVLSWDAILEALKEDHYTWALKIGTNASGASSHLSYYGIDGIGSEGNSNTELSHPSESDSISLSVSILMLCFSMIADGISINFNTLLSVKEHLVRVLGFENITLRPSASGQTFFVEFGSVPEIPKEALSCISELSSVLDSPCPLDLSFLGPGLHGQDGGAAPLLVGSPYVDVALGLFCTLNDLRVLPVLTLKCLLETLGIVIYKHDFEKTLLRPQQAALRKAVARALQLLPQDINYECRQQALSVVQAYIKRWHSSMGAFVHTAVEEVAKLISSQGLNNQDALVAQAKSFLDATLNAYCSSGIFSGLFKRRLSPDFFTVVKHIVEGSKVSPNPGSGLLEPLRVLLLRDTLSRALELDINSFQLVVDNVQAYIDTVFHQGYPPELMIFVGHHLTLFARKTSEWPADAVDATPLLSVAATLIQHNKAHSREMLSYLDTLLRVVLSRMNVDKKILSHLINVNATVYRRNTFSDEANLTNGVVSIILESLSDSLRMKSRVSPTTIKSMLEAVLEPDVFGTSALTSSNHLLGLVDPGLHFMQHHWWVEAHTENDFAASLAVGRMVLCGTQHDASIIAKLAEQEKISRPNLAVRTWNMLLLVALTDGSEVWCSLLFSQLSAFSTLHHNVLRAYFQAGVSPPEFAISDVNHAYIAIKLWLLLALKLGSFGGRGDASPIAVWNELWPPFENIASMLETEAQAGLSMTLSILTFSTVSDLFVFVRSLRTAVGLHTSSQIALLRRLKSLGRGEIQETKFSRAMKSLTDSPTEADFDVMVTQAGKDIVAAEKLRVLESGRKDHHPR